jgi:hypothetical protein
VLVGQEQCDYAGRRRVHERARHVVASVDGGVERCEVAPQRLAVLVADRAATHGSLVLRAGAGLDLPVAEAGERVEVGRRRARDVVELEPGQAVAHVCRVANLAHLAVADEVDPGIDLVRDSVGDRCAHDALELGVVDRAAVVLSEHDVDDLLGPREATDMCGQHRQRWSSMGSR